MTALVLRQASVEAWEQGERERQVAWEAREQGDRKGRPYMLRVKRRVTKQ